MDYSIVPYDGSSPGIPPMKPWPSLAAKAFYFKCKSPAGSSVFFYDSRPDKTPESQNSRFSEPKFPVFVLIHGLGDEADSWRHLIPLLNAQGCRTLAPDLGGFGRSAPPGRISVKNYAAAILGLLEAVCPGTPAILAGNSMGAVIAETAAAQRPDLVKGLVLIDGSIPGGPSNPGPLAVLKMLFSRKWYRAFRNYPETAWASLFPYYADLEAMPRDDREFLRQRVMDRVNSSTQEQAFFAVQRNLVLTYMMRRSWYIRKIRNFKGKILLIWGEKDRIMPISSAETFKALRYDINLIIIKGAGHLPQQERPEETAKIMSDFADSTAD